MIKIIEHNGFLALDFGCVTNADKPVIERAVLVGDVKAADWPGLVGQHASDVSKGAVLIWIVGRNLPYRMPVEGWQWVTIETPVKSPRRGKDWGGKYHWRWMLGQWHKRYDDGGYVD